MEEETKNIVVQDTGNVAEWSKASVSNTEELQSSESSNLSVSLPVEEIKPPKNKKQTSSKIPLEIIYRLNFRRTNGDIRADLSKAVVYTLVQKWSDLLRIIPSNRWSTLDEIVNMVWDWEKRQYRKLYTRTRKQIEEGVKELREAGVIQSKEK